MRLLRVSQIVARMTLFVPFVRAAIRIQLSAAKIAGTEEYSILRSHSSRRLIDDDASSSSPAIRDYNIVPAFPTDSDWKSYNETSVRVFRNAKINSVDELLHKPIKVGFLQTTKTRLRHCWRRFCPFLSRPGTASGKELAVMIRAPDPFADGWLRLAYFGRLANSKKRLRQPESTMVFKAFKAGDTHSNRVGEYLTQMEISNAAHYLAELYNEKGRPSYCPKIHFLQVCVVEEIDPTGEAHASGGDLCRFAAEPIVPLDGSEFIKFSSCMGYWKEDVPDNILETLLRFTIFVYDATDGNLLVADLQGIWKPHEVILTDPSILCTDGTRFRDCNNFGYGGIQLCMKSTRDLMQENGWKP